jgi:hypothetical protein
VDRDIKRMLRRKAGGGGLKTARPKLSCNARGEEKI